VLLYAFRISTLVGRPASPCRETSRRSWSQPFDAAVELSVSYRKHFHWIFVSYVEHVQKARRRVAGVAASRGHERELSVEPMVARKPSTAFNPFFEILDSPAKRSCRRWAWDQ